jgi:hypothetical protein
MRLRPAGSWQGDARVVPPATGVLGDESAPAPTRSFALFDPAAPPIELAARPVLPPAVLGEAAPPPAMLEYQPDDDAVYVLLQQIQTPDGTIYDWTLPQPVAAAPADGVLSGDTSAESVLRFPINPVVAGGTPGADPSGGVLGLEDLAGGLIGDFAAKRILQVLKSPIDRALLNGVKHAEVEPQMLALRDTFQPLDGAEAWRALLPPGGERRVLLYIHGFASSTAGSGGGAILPELARGYDAVLSYDHPTLSRDPLENARDLLAMIPDDLRLSVDLVAHSRGGLVARSLVELVEPLPQWRTRMLITHGTPHSGTRLADPERWDRLISLGMTAASWLAVATGVVVWLPKLLEYVLKAAAQGVFSLPGIAGMEPGGEFIKKLNAPNSGGQTHYAVVTSSFSIFNVKEPGFRQALMALATQAFIDAPNDLVVPTASMSAIDLPGGALPADRQLKAAVDHFSYFQDPGVIAFLRQQLASG